MPGRASEMANKGKAQRGGGIEEDGEECKKRRRQGRRATEGKKAGRRSGRQNAGRGEQIVQDIG